mmetsp:Transcript_8734/g.15809  ORF Transcript_8734/g.15809 Transcript_8734/m.15809 type:complete len:179 (+) Transcript_8734:158-694(+)|eukprot:CAMPEP_0201613686 /NCGR_PEP_ID=MMETSP0492-20130828/26721_1 /ASSEMBLY_ACC=CAM_ASM_000837 /TAXON_ID=420259 /ORGANISM="Thalassiosira gravida, Strain GMp14c1" /LENGTH=178 /DNA_ID=CAMNT_0048080685 /DNA_START=78 /DNA_END=614 /DNA_ORIENTATION=+
MMLRAFSLGLLAIGGTSAFSPVQHQQRLTTTTELSATEVDRRTVLANVAFAALSLGSAPATSLALDTIPADNEIIKEQRTVVGKLDVNNAAVADYMKYPGMYPSIGGKIANGGPFKSVRDVYKIKGLTKVEIAKIKEYESDLTATPSTGLDPMRGRDPYRTNFNSFRDQRGKAPVEGA